MEYPEKHLRVERCVICGTRLPSGTREDFCPFCVPDDPVALEVRRLGDCELFEELGRGSMGVVWRGRQLGLDRAVAVKTLPGGDLAAGEARERFQLEARAIARLKHPNITAIYDVGEADGTPYFVMEFVNGESLSAYISQNSIPARKAAGLLREAALAVQHAHENGVLHRDLKPSNILIESETDRLCVTDFGLAKFTDGQGAASLSGKAAGSPAYMPPEQARHGESTIRSDVYGLGSVLYCMLTGRAPFRGESLAAVLAQVESEEPLPPRSLNPDVPRDLENICLKCLEKNPERRYATAEALAEDLQRFLDRQAVLARPANPAKKAWRIMRRHPWRVAAMALAMALVGAVMVSLFWKAHNDRQHAMALEKEQSATARALMHTQLGEAQAIISLREADSRLRAEEIIRKVVTQRSTPDLSSHARDIAIQAMALPFAKTEAMPGGGVAANDWTMTTADLAGERWALAEFGGRVSIRSSKSAAEISSFTTAPRKITALMRFSPTGRWLAMRHG
ncbi:MAG: serine/threonine protein kinase [Akkermansiaceae bacterium]|nr:serine/threonine protein kinase [Akkermansiaceae bacterium]